MSEGAGCYRRPPGTSLKIGGLDVGNAGLPDIIEKVLERLNEPDPDQKAILLSELKVRNYVPRRRSPSPPWQS